MDILIDFFFEALWFMAWWGLVMFSVTQFVKLSLALFANIMAAVAYIAGPK